jgi:hypothetical protein
MEEMIRRGKFLYEQQREKPTFRKAWENKNKFNMDQSKKGTKTPFFRNNPQGHSGSREPRKVEVGGQLPRKTPMECWGFKGNHRYRDCSHINHKVRVVHNV